MNEKILLVDDDRSVRVTLTEVLQKAGYQVVTAVDGEHALEKVNEDNFDLVLLDMNLPGVDGIEVLRRIKVEIPSQQVIMITGYGTIETAVEAMKLGACDYIQKPFSPQEICTLVKKVLERRELQASSATSYDSSLEYAKKAIGERDFEKAQSFLKKAMEIDPRKPEPFNLLGVISEMKGNVLEAQRLYRAALALDPTYRPAMSNLDRTVTFGKRNEPIKLEDVPEDKEPDSKCTE